MAKTKDRAAFLKLARERFEMAQTADKDQRARELADIEFYNGEQWPADIKTLRKGQDQNAANGLPPVPARPCVTVNMTKEPVRQVLNQERQSDMGIEIVPADDFGELIGPIDESEIQLREGLVRRIQRSSEAGDARTWAFNRAVIAGRGYYGVMTRYAPGKTNDQEVYVHRYYDQSCVTLDPAHEQPDGSDAGWGFVSTWMAWDRYVADYGKRNEDVKNPVCAWESGDFESYQEKLPQWYRYEGETRMVRVVDYWYTTRETRVLVTYANADGSRELSEWADDEAAAIPDGFAEVSRRRVVDKKIQWAKIDGCDVDVLEETEWPGPDLPIVKVLGEELQPSDDQRRVEGMIRSMREPAQGFNVMVSKWIEMIGLSNMTDMQVPIEAIEGFEAWYQLRNTRTLPYLPYNQWTEDGREINPPTPAVGQSPPIEAVAGSIQLLRDAIQSTSGVHDPALGKVDPSIKSGRAIKALQEQSARGSNHFLDNLQRSIRYEGQIINNLLYPIYGRPGRIARILNAEQQPETVLIGQPMIRQNGRPVPVPEGHPQAKTYTLTKDAQFNVIVKVSKNYDSRREQEREILGDLISSNPELMTWFGDLYFQNMDGPGHQQMADRAKLMLAPAIQQSLAAKAQGTPLPPEIQAQVASKDGQIQQLTQELQKAATPGYVEQIKQQGQAQIKAADLDFQREKLYVESETKEVVAELGAKVDRMGLLMEQLAQLREEWQAHLDRAHEVGMAAMQQSHERDLGAQGHQQQLEQGAQGADLAMTQAEHQQAIAPPEQAGA